MARQLASARTRRKGLLAIAAPRTYRSRLSPGTAPGLARAVAVVAGVAALVALSFLLVRPAPSYDPWAWLLWGREVAGGALDTREGPAFKPLPVGVGALLSPFGGAAPWLWVALVRAAAVVALWLSFQLGRRLARGAWLAGGVAALSVALCAHFVGTAAAGAETALLLALGLAAVEAWRSGRPGWALVAGAGCALLRVEAWPFLAVAAAAWWRRRRAVSAQGGEPAAVAEDERAALAPPAEWWRVDPRGGALVAAGAALIAALWLVPELLGSGDPLRSGTRALVPNPGQPALAEVPALAALWEAVKLPLWPLWVGVLALGWEALARPEAGRGAPRRHAGRRGSVAAAARQPAGGRGSVAAARAALLPAVAGIAWILLVAAMAEAGFSGEARYSLPGAALISVSGAVGLVGTRRGRRPAVLVALALVLVAVACAPRIDELRDVRAGQAHQWALARDLATAIDAAGGREAVLACGRPYVGRYRGPLMAYRLDVAKRVVEPDDPPRPPGMVFRSARTAGESVTPAAPADFEVVARAGAWTVLGAGCRRSAVP